MRWVLPMGDEDGEAMDHDAPEEVWGGWTDNEVLALFNDIFSHIHPALVIRLCEAALDNGLEGEDIINLGFEG